MLAALAHSALHASFERQPQPAPLWGRGLSGCALPGTDFSLLNPASLAASPVASTTASTVASLVAPPSSRITLFHSPSPFDLPELSNGGALLTVPTRIGTLQAAVTLSGKDLYREQTATLSYAVALDDAVSFGAAISYNALTIERYGAAHTFGIDIGIAVAPAPDLSLGASVLNVNRPTIGTEQDELPRIVVLGAAYRLSDRANISADIVKDVRFPESVRVGIEVRPIDFLALRCGASTEPHRFHAGAGVRYLLFGIEYGVTTHQELGLTHSIGLSIEL